MREQYYLGYYEERDSLCQNRSEISIKPNECAMSTCTVNPVFKVAPLLFNFFLGPDFTNSPKAKPVIKVTGRLLKLCGYMFKPCLNHPQDFYLQQVTQTDVIFMQIGYDAAIILVFVFFVGYSKCI